MAPEFMASFEAFLAEVGPRPSTKHTIDRIDNNRGYEPGNLRWATRTEQNRNRRSGKLTAADAAEIRALSGTVSQAMIARRFGVTQSLVSVIVNGAIWKEQTP